jgi:hypothetical protein
MASTDSTVTIIARNAAYPITVSYYNNLEEVKAEDLLTRQQLQSLKACEHWMKRVGATDAEYMLYCMQRVWTPRK